MSHTHKQYLLTIVREYSTKTTIANLFYLDEANAKNYGSEAIKSHKSNLKREAHYSVMELEVVTADARSVGINSNTPVVDSFPTNDHQSN
jgi:hypothetical protein